MLNETLDSTRLWNANSYFSNEFRRVSAPSWLNPQWLDDRIQTHSHYDGVTYSRLRSPSDDVAISYHDPTHHNGEFFVPSLTLHGNNPDKHVLLLAIHAYEWAAIESIMGFTSDWGNGKVNPQLKERYQITAIPLVSIDQFPGGYGSDNSHSDFRFDTIRNAANLCDVAIEIHETPQHYLLNLLSFISTGDKEPNTDIDIAYSGDRGRIERIQSLLGGLSVTTERSCRGYCRQRVSYQGKPNYRLELYSDYGEIGELFLLTMFDRLAYPLTEITTFINRSIRRKSIKQSRLQSAENGKKAIKAILEAHL